MAGKFKTAADNFGKMTGDAILQALNWAYDKALDPDVEGIESVDDLAKTYRRKGKSARACAETLVRWQCAKTATTGFVTGMGGLATLPVTIPADLAATYFINLRMVAAIAKLGGLDPRDDRVRTYCFICLVGDGLNTALGMAGAQVGQKVTLKLLERLPGATLSAINRAVGFRLATKAGSTGVINLGKMVPVVGGVVNGTVNGYFTHVVGQQAIKLFIDGELETVAA
ncbi:MAG: EcsC family protein [Deltaproteobacteria bacterium]|nr:EcsC family protein [Deltaproteobacteria bacterium]